MKQILINSEELQVRVAVVEDGKLQDFFMERNNKDRIVGSIFKGRIKNLEPSLQAAFVDIGVGKNAFLHYWDMLPASQDVLEEADDDDDAKDAADIADDDDDAASDTASGEHAGESGNDPMPILPASVATPERNNGNSRRNNGGNNNGNQHQNRANNQKNGQAQAAAPHDSQLIDKLLPIADSKKRSEIIALDKTAKNATAPSAPATAEGDAHATPQILPLTATAPAATPPAPASEPQAVIPPVPHVVEVPEAPQPPQLQQFRNQSRKPNNGQVPDVQRQNQEFNRQRVQNQPEGGSRRRRRRSRNGNRQDGAAQQSGAKQPVAKPGFFRRLCEALLPSSWFSTTSKPAPSSQPVRPQQNSKPAPQAKNAQQQGNGGNGQNQGSNAAKPQILPLTPDGKPQPVPKKAEKRAAKPEKKGPTVEDIPNLFHVDQEILVQVTKGPIGTKGARVTTNLSIPGRNLVLLPNCSHVGVSRRVEDREERSRLKQMVKSLTLPPNMGLICRTVGAGLKREHFQRDLDILLDAWHKGEELRDNRKAPVCIYQEPALEERVLRDCLTQDIDEIVVDTKEAYDRAREMLSRFDKQSVEKLKLYSNPTPIFIKYGIAQQIENISNRKVMLPSGGYLCIDETEALIAIDVNTGKNRSGKDQPETILETNLEAVKEIARQLRLRNIGGLVVLDLIDMRSRKDQMAVYRAFKQYTSEDHARIKIYPISGLGLLEMSRQRESESLESTMFEDCPYCKGRGLIKTATSVSVEIQRRLNELLARRKDVQHFAITVHPKILERLRTADHKVMDAMAQEYNRQISFTGNPNLHIEEYHIVDKATGKEY